MNPDARLSADATLPVIASSLLTCPHCGWQSRELMATDACTWFHTCASCSRLLTPKPGDCCVFCSYGDTPCPPIQLSRDGSSSAERPDCCR